MSLNLQLKKFDLFSKLKKYHELKKLDITGTYSFHFPTSIRFGAGVVKELPDYLLASGVTKPLLVTDTLVADLKFFKAITHDLTKRGVQVEIFKEIHKNPIKSDVLTGAEQYHQTGRDGIIGIGGGSPLDVARAIALRINHHQDLFDYDDIQGGEIYVTEAVPHFVTIPTTAGTGSEVGRSAVIAEDSSKKKRVLFSPKLMARKVFADPVLTMDIPPSVTAATGMDALTHHMEAYLAKGFQPMCDGIALEGISLIAESLAEVTHRPSLLSRSKMLLASLMGAVAFQKGLGIVHCLAHPLSTLLDTHHGLANAVNLPVGLKFNYSGLEERFDRMALAFGLGEQTGDQLADRISQLIIDLGLPNTLSELGVRKAHIPQLAELAIQDFCLPANPKPVTEEDFFRLYSETL